MILKVLADASSGRFSWAMIFTLILMAPGCTNNIKQRYDSAIRSGGVNIPLVSRLQQLLNGRACDTILYFDSAPEWNLSFTLYDRYELDVRFPIEIDKDGIVKPTGDATCYVTEVLSVKMRGPGPGSYETVNGSSWEISSTDLFKALESPSGFDVLGIPLKKENPVEGFHRVKSIKECE